MPQVEGLSAIPNRCGLQLLPVGDATLRNFLPSTRTIAFTRTELQRGAKSDEDV